MKTLCVNFCTSIPLIGRKIVYILYIKKTVVLIGQKFKNYTARRFKNLKLHILNASFMCETMEMQVPHNSTHVYA